MQAKNHFIFERSLSQAIFGLSLALLQLELPHLRLSHDDPRHLPHDRWRSLLQGNDVYGRLSFSLRLHLNHHVCLSVPTQLSHVGCLADSCGQLRHGRRHRLRYSTLVQAWCFTDRHLAWWPPRSHPLQFSVPFIRSRESNPSTMAGDSFLCCGGSSPIYDIL